LVDKIDLISTSQAAIGSCFSCYLKSKFFWRL